MEAVNEEKHNASSDLYQCRLGQKYISSTADIVQYPHFEAGVVKIKKGIENLMNEFEKPAVSILKKPISSSGTTGLGGTFLLTISVNEWLRGRNEMKKTSNYIDCKLYSGLRCRGGESV